MADPGLSVRCPVVVRVTVAAPATHRCPFRDEVDHGTVHISWTTRFGETLELHALAQLISANAPTKISHEQWTADLAAAINARAGVDELTVRSRWRTGGGAELVAEVEPAAVSVPFGLGNAGCITGAAESQGG